MSNTQRLPQWRCTVPVPLDSKVLRAVEQKIASCESCTPDTAEVPFDFLLDCLTGCDPETTDYVLPEPVHCPRCGVAVRAGYWRWSDSADEGRTVFILPGTLITLKDE
ncbi:MAG TPA: hypothetical protein VGK48_14975 [Terriglobia bacterium]|jgi:hypothetical protein